MKKTILNLVNNERKQNTIKSSKGCYYLDAALCFGGATDICITYDYATCVGTAVDKCYTDYDSCSTGNDIDL